MQKIASLRIIVMASGLSRRFGSNKLLRPIAGRPMFMHILNLLHGYQTECMETTDVIVVSAWPEILKAADEFGFIAVRNEENEKGIAESIKLGLAAPGSFEPDLAAFFTADQPFFSATSLQKFVRTALLQSDRITCVRAGKRLGNPVAFPRDLFGELQALEGDVGGKAVLRKHPKRVFYVDVPLHELQDIDTPEDFAAMV
ncbi:MAG TPA: nucleotidyltransferase family protein [Clostridiaceae bacterium]|nr:nucleotidyltransferase family protein [Clostridiaceae bacterium]